MGLLIKGEWHDQWYETKENDGDFVREDSIFRRWLSKDGEAGVSGSAGFKAEKGRYHLYVSMACPWAHRTLIFRQLKGLEDWIDLTMVHPHMLDKGWAFAPKPEPLHGFDHMHQVYTHAKADYTGRVVVPVLWDKKTQTIVSNESSEIIRMFNDAFNHLTGNELDFYPEALRAEIDAVNADVYEHINNGVYRCGFATSQAAYDRAFDALFAALQRMEDRLDEQRYLVGDTLTEADWRLFTTLVRFDAVYFGHFKCNFQSIADYPNLSNYLRDLYQYPDIAQTVDLDHIQQHYYYSHDTINPSRIVPKGPALYLDAAHDRDRFGSVE
ncbi:MAG: glutathione S-transferase family protein [Mariprofundaceae bacterium]|nr:glutathione S-transferase family protein [Mariprofundaceae bacterium]